MNVLILSPHADDAELGCGGSAAKFIEDGDNLLWIVLSTAEDSLPANLLENLYDISVNSRFYAREDKLKPESSIKCS